MGSELSTFYRYNLKQITGSLINELNGEALNWSIVFQKGKELQELSETALQEQVNERQEYIKSKYREGNGK